MSEEARTYKEFTIYPRPLQLRGDVEAWSTAATIMRGPAAKAISASSRWGTREEAVKHSLEFAIRVIDGLVPGLSVDDL